MNNQLVQPVQPGSSTTTTLDDCLDWLEDAAARSTVVHDHLAPDRCALAALQLAVDVDEALKAVLQHVQDKRVQVDAEQADALQMTVDKATKAVQDKRVQAAVDLVAKHAEQADALRPATLAQRKLQMMLEQCPSSDNYKIRNLKTQLAELTTQHQVLVAHNQSLVTQIQELNTRHQALVASTANLGLTST